LCELVLKLMVKNELWCRSHLFCYFKRALKKATVFAYASLEAASLKTPIGLLGSANPYAASNDLTVRPLPAAFAFISNSPLGGLNKGFIHQTQPPRNYCTQKRNDRKGVLRVWFIAIFSPLHDEAFA
jgi:hypothetical protein